MALGRQVFGTVLIVGVSALAVAAMIASPSILRASRPMAREALRRGLKLYERVRDAAAEFTEDVEDLVAEVQGELRTKGTPDAPPGQGAPNVTAPADAAPTGPTTSRE